jgi:hypothetical protein
VTDTRGCCFSDSLHRRPPPFPSPLPLSTFPMAHYLPVLLVSVNTNAVPDDSALVTLPRGQVDYLSHEWQEEDVWRSWRNMTRQKNAIANGARLENASWRTWWKQRNKLKTISPETLNWLVATPPHHRPAFANLGYSYLQTGSKTQM